VSNPYKTKQFEELKKKWYKKLEKTGFEDIEQADGRLVGKHGEWFKYYHNPTLDLAKQDYFRHAGYFLYEHKFANDFERRIWELHVEGISIRNIAKILSKRYPRVTKKYGKINKRKVHETLKPLVNKLIEKIKVK